MTIYDYIDNVRDAINIPEADDPKEALKKKCESFRKILVVDNWLHKVPVDAIAVGLFDQVKFKIKGEKWLEGVFVTPEAKRVFALVDKKIKMQVCYILYIVQEEYEHFNNIESGGDSVGLQKEKTRKRQETRCQGV